MRKSTGKNFYKVRSIQDFYDPQENVIDYYLKDIERFKGQWLGTDNPKRWEETKKNFIDHPDVKYWENNPIHYHFNNHNFRTPDDFNYDDEGIIFLGCSHTSGIGLHWEQVWAHHVCTHYNKKAWNMAVGGMGIHTAYRNFVMFTQGAKRLKAKKVLVYNPHFYRMEFFSDRERTWVPVTVNTLTDMVGMGSQAHGIFVDLLYSEKTAFWTLRSHLDAIKLICNSLDMEMYVDTTMPVYKIDEAKEPGPHHARDFAHCTPLQHEYIAKKFIENIEKGNQYDPATYDFMQMAWDIDKS